MKKHGRKILNILILVVFSVGILVYFLKDDFFGIVETLKSTQWLIIFLALGFQSIAYIFEGMQLVIFARKYKPDYSFKEGLQNAFIGHFFSYITPSATGGQFAQVYVFEKQNIKVENSGSILVMEFIAKELVLIFYCGITIFVKYSEFASKISNINIFGLSINFITLAIIGFATHFIGMGGIIFLSYSRFLNKVFRGIIRLLGKMKITKNPEKIIAKTDDKISMYRKELADIRGNLKPFLAACAFIAIRYLFIFIAPFIVAIALGVSVIFSDISTSIILASYVTLITMFVPIPGASGGAEAVFVLLFASFFGTENLARSGMIIWRFITFYYPFIIGLITALSFNRKRRTKMFMEINEEYSERFYSVYRKKEEEVVIND